MKYSTLAFLCCSVFLTACDNSSNTGSKGDNLLDKASSIANDAGDKVKDASEKVAGSVSEKIDNAIESTKEATKDVVDNAVDSAKDEMEAVVDSAKDTATKVVDDTLKAGKDISSAVAGKTDEVIAVAPKVDDTDMDIKEGEVLFKSTCIACHGSGVAGSPKLGDKADWALRIAQGKAVLVEHAINGFRGKEGYYMPAKGGSTHLSDEQVAQIVEFMMSKVK